MTITVTRKDIEGGRRCDPDCCPVARALNRAGVAHFGVIGAGVKVVDEDQRTVTLPFPAEVMDWILEFDGKRPVEPISFELQVPFATGDHLRKPGYVSRRRSPIVKLEIPRARGQQKLAA